MNDVDRILDGLRRKGWRMATAESCTGGMVAAALTDVPGASDVFERGFVTYSNVAKIALLGISEADLKAYGAVSEPVAKGMAVGALERSGVDLAIATTGIAGPGGSEFKPEGRVCFGLAVKGLAPFTETVDFGALGRAQVRKVACEHALHLIGAHSS